MTSQCEDEETVLSFSTALADLTVNNKPQISFLTTVARENLKQAEAIVEAVSDHLNKVSNVVKLPILYLIDSILKNVGEDYIRLFSSVLSKCFYTTFKEVDEKTRQILCHLRQSWTNVVPANILCDIDVQIHALDPVWCLNFKPSNTFQNSPVKILVNRSFLPSGFSQPCEEEDEAEVLRAQLLFQKRVRELKMEQNAKKLSSVSTLVNNKIHAAVVSRKEISPIKATETITLDEDLPESQADSTTIDKISNVPVIANDKIEVNRTVITTSSMPVSNVKSVPDKPVNGQLIQLLSGLINQQSLKSQGHVKELQQLPKGYVGSCHQRAQGRNYSPSYKWEESRRYSDHFLNSHGSNRHHLHSTRRNRSLDSDSAYCQVEGNQKFCFADRNLNIRNGNHNSSYMDRARSLTPTPSNCQDLFPQLVDLNRENEIKVASYRSPKRKPDSNGVYDGPKAKSSNTNFASSMRSSTFAYLGGKHQSSNNTTDSSFEYQHKCTLYHKPSYPTIGHENNSNHGENFVSGTEEGAVTTKSNKLVLEESETIDKHSYGKRNMEFQLALNINSNDHRGTDRFSSPCHSQDSLVPLPPANSFVLQKIIEDTMKTIPLDGVSREVRFYGEMAIIGAGSNNPREVFFKPGEALITLNNTTVLCAFQRPGKEVVLKGKTYRVQLGAPTRELYVNDEGFQCAFNSSPVELTLSTGEILIAQLQSSIAPVVEMGDIRRDLVSGQVMLNIDAMHFVRIFLDAKPQRFYLNGVPLTIKFANDFEVILVNDQPVNMQFGGPPISISVIGVQYLVSISELPSLVIPGHNHITSMTRIATQVFSHDRHRSYILEVQSNRVRARRSQKTNAHQIGPHSQKATGKREFIRSKVSEKRRMSMQYRYRKGKVKGPYMPPPSWVPVSRNKTLCNCTEAADSSRDAVKVQQPNVNVHELFQNLCDVGLLKPPSPIVPDEVHEVDFYEPSSFKRKQPRVVEQLHNGIQCSSCGKRFPLNLTKLYRQHLDYHFQENHRLRNPQNHLRRSWYPDKQTWVQLEEASFERELEFENAVLEEKCAVSKKAESSVPSHDCSQEAACAVCCEKFEEFFHHEKDEWHLKDCVSSDGTTFHPSCLNDYQKSSATIISVLEEQVKSRSELSHIDVCLEGSKINSQSRMCDAKNEEQGAARETVLCMAGGSLLRCDEAGSVESNLPNTNDTLSTSTVGFCVNKEQNKKNVNVLHGDCVIEKCGDGAGLSQKDTPQVNLKSVWAFSPCDSSNQRQNVIMTSEKLEPLVLKPKLVGRKLIQLPPAVKGSETSNLCCLS